MTEAAHRGRLDVMVNNAGRVGVWHYIEDTTVEEWDQALQLLLRGAFLGIKHAAAAMRLSGGGSIINTGSVAGIRAGFGPHPYSAAKAGLLGLSRRYTRARHHDIRSRSAAMSYEIRSPAEIGPIRVLAGHR